jgi:hypothetical protein
MDAKECDGYFSILDLDFFDDTIAFPFSREDFLLLGDEALHLLNTDALHF